MSWHLTQNIMNFALWTENQRDDLNVMAFVECVGNVSTSSFQASRHGDFPYRDMMVVRPLISIMGIPTPLKRHLYIKTVHWMRHENDCVEILKDFDF